MSESTVKKMTYNIPVNVLDRDENGNPTSVQCPCCREPANVGPDGEIMCDLRASLASFLRTALYE